MSNLPDLSELYATAEKDRFEFLKTDLALCFTFVEIATTERQLGDLVAASEAIARAESGYAAMEQLLFNVDTVEYRNEIERKLTDLRAALDAVRRQSPSNADQQAESA